MSDKAIEYTSYEISKRLHDKGFRAEHSMMWNPPLEVHGRKWHLKLYPCPDDKAIPAHTFTELLNIIPLGIEMQQWLFVRMESMPNRRMIMGYGSINGSQLSHEYPAECIAKLVDWLIDKGFLKVTNG